MTSLTWIHLFTYGNSVTITPVSSASIAVVYRTSVHCFSITQKLFLETSKTNTSFSRLSASGSYVSLDLQQDNMHFASTLLQCFYHAN